MRRLKEPKIMGRLSQLRFVYTDHGCFFLTEVDDGESWHKLNSTHVRARVSPPRVQSSLFVLHLLNLGGVKIWMGKARNFGSDSF